MKPSKKIGNWAHKASQQTKQCKQTFLVIQLIREQNNDTKTIIYI